MLIRIFHASITSAACLNKCQGGVTVVVSHGVSLLCPASLPIEIDNNHRCTTCSPHHSPPGRCRVPRPVSRCCRTWDPGGSQTRARSSQHQQQRRSSILPNCWGVGSFPHTIKHTQYSAMTIDMEWCCLCTDKNFESEKKVKHYVEN